MADLLPNDNPLTTRIRNVAQNEGLTVEQFAAWTDNELRRVSNLGRKSLGLLRQYYPAPGTEICPHCGQSYVPSRTPAKDAIVASLERLQNPAYVMSVIAECERLGLIPQDE